MGRQRQVIRERRGQEMGRRSAAAGLSACLTALSVSLANAAIHNDHGLNIESLRLKDVDDEHWEPSVFMDNMS